MPFSPLPFASSSAASHGSRGAAAAATAVVVVLAVADAVAAGWGWCLGCHGGEATGAARDHGVALAGEALDAWFRVAAGVHPRQKLTQQRVVTTSVRTRDLHRRMVFLVVREV